MSVKSWMLSGALVLLIVVSAVGVVFSRNENRRLFNQLEALERARDELNIEFGRLQLEQATWADTHRIEKIAIEDLGMVFPNPAQTKVLRQ
jgi:cell division protein FtsL